VVDGEYIDQGARKGEEKKINDDDLMMYNADNDYALTDDDLESPQTIERKDFKFKTFKAEDMGNPFFKVGMLFSSIKMLRKTITEYSLKKKVEIKLSKNGRRRVRAHYAEKGVHGTCMHPLTAEPKLS
jgi:hypothetical protein